MITIYGIKNCDMIKKAMKWLETNGHDFTLHDYKKDGVPADLIKQALDQCGWETVINQRGTTWRQLPDEVKSTMNNDRAYDIIQQNASIIKRPMVHVNDEFHFGFKENLYRSIL